MFAIILFISYFILLLFIVNYVAARKIFNFNFWQTTTIFSFKVFLGCLYGYIFLKYYGGDDTWNFYNDSLLEYDKLIHHPGIFFKEFLPESSFARANNFIQGVGFYLHDLEYRIMVKLLAILNILSRKNYYADVLLFDFLICWGPFLIFKLLVSSFPDKKNILLIAIFFVPPTTFWLSGIRGDGLLFLFLSMILYFTNKWSNQKKISSLAYMVASFVGVIIFRLQMLLVFFPIFLCWLISIKGRRRPIFYFLLIYLICLGIFFGSMLVSPEANFSMLLVKRQQEFFLLHGNTRFKLDSLQPTVSSFIKIFPQAFINSFVRPFIWEAKGPLQIFAAVENIVGWAIFALLFIFPEKKYKKFYDYPLLLLFVFYSLSQILLVGYIVPFPGAIVRYKTIPELLLVAVAAVAINWNKFLINYNKI